jgi:predicted NBD/HSP70 family sugar kinase
LRGANGVAGEFGHVSIDETGPLCNCGNRGCWEVFASNTAAINHYVNAASNGNSRRQNNQFESDKPSFDDILHLSEQGDRKAIETIERMAHYLGIGLSMLISGMAPSMIVLIGEVTRSWKRIEPIIKNVLNARLQGSPMVTRILPAENSLQPRLRGSMALILQKHFGAPLIA